MKGQPNINNNWINIYIVIEAPTTTLREKKAVWLPHRIAPSPLAVENEVEIVLLVLTMFRRIQPISFT